MNKKWEWAFRLLGFVLVAMVFYIWNLVGHSDDTATAPPDNPPALSDTVSSKSKS